ncbi:MAG: sortase domain-containing protein [Pseudonocardiaceae bacterium]
MHCRTKVALAVAVALILGVTGCGAAESSSGRDATVALAAAPAPNPAALLPDPPAPPAESPAPPHEYVAPAAPTGFVMSGPAFDIKANVCQMKYARPLNPPGDQKRTVCWVQKGFGVAPGSDSGGTSYILGHAWAKTPLIFNPLSELAMQEVTGQNPEMQSGVPTFPVQAINGYTIVLRNPNGTLTYTVTRVFAVRKSQAGKVKSLMANTPNRVVLITCGVKDGVDVDYNIIVDAYLASSTAG